METLSENNNLWLESWRRFKKNKISLYSLIAFFLITSTCFSFSIISNISSTKSNFLKKHEVTNLKYGAQPPSLLKKIHIFGTDELGRDLFFRTMVGGTISLTVSVIAVFFALIIGITIGSISALMGGWKDDLIMRSIDILYSLPLIVFVILVSTMTKKPIDTFISNYDLSNYKGLINISILFFLIGAVTWLTMARIVRTQVMMIKNKEFIDASKIMGIPKYIILFKHILPNIIGPVIIYSTLSIPSIMLTESTLSFLGLGIQAPLSSWGSLIKDGANKMDVYPWLLIFPAIMFSTTLFVLNFIGDGLRDAIDPKS